MIVPWFEVSILIRESAIVRVYIVKRNIRYNVVRVTSLEKKTIAKVRVKIVDEVIRAILCIKKTISGM